tara:strand:- start:516 stop:803 length:288 start_codon:yes stop_codon:yes gene_type:complete
MTEENKTDIVTVFVDGEQREYKLSTLSPAATRKLRDIDISNNIINTQASKLALLQMGVKSLNTELQPLLPEKGFTVVQSKGDEVESNTSETKKDS